MKRDNGASKPMDNPSIRDWVEQSGRPAPTRVPLSALQDGFAVRAAGVDPKHVALLAQAPGDLPPVVVHRSTMRIIDGLHRVSAVRRAGGTTVDANFFDGTDDEAFALGAYLNTGHGLPLSLSDRKAAALAILAASPQWSDRFVSKLVGLSHVTVAGIRQQPDAGAALTAERLGGDGRLRPADPVVGRTRVSALLSSDPELSLRQLARRAGVSVSTARDVRIRMQEGRDPVPDRLRPDLNHEGGEFGSPPNGADARSPKGALRHSPDTSAVESGRQSGATRVPSMLLQRLKRDPSIRFSESGRHLIRFLTGAHAALMQAQEATHLVPSHCVPAVAQLANSMSVAWKAVADDLAERHSDYEACRSTV